MREKLFWKCKSYILQKEPQLALLPLMNCTLKTFKRYLLPWSSSKFKRASSLHSVFGLSHNETPEYAKEIFHRPCDTQNRELGNSKTDFYIPLSKNFLGINNFAYRGVCIWNNLSNETPLSKNFLGINNFAYRWECIWNNLSNETPLSKNFLGINNFAYRGVCIWNNLSNETPLSKNFLGINNFAYRGVCIWNNLSNETPLSKNFLGINNFAYRGVCIWNNLSNETKASKSFLVI